MKKQTTNQLQIRSPRRPSRGWRRGIGCICGHVSPKHEWQMRIPKDGRKIGVVVHHVATMYPVEIQLARLLAAGRPITDVTWDAVATMNRDHAKENDGVTKEAALALLATNSAAAAAGHPRIYRRRSSTARAPVSLNSDAPLTCQFMLEDHAVRHSYHHLGGIRAALAGPAELKARAAG